MRVGSGLGALVALLTVLTVGGLMEGARSQGTPRSDSDYENDIVLKRQTLMEECYEFAEDDEIDEDDGVALQREAADIAKKLAEFRSMFPPESNPKHPKYSSPLPSYALPSVWEKPGEFSAFLDVSIKAARELAAEKNKEKFAELGKILVSTCEACHDAFRAPVSNPFDGKW